MKYCFVKTFSVPYASLKVSYEFGVYFLVFDVRWFASRFEILFSFSKVVMINFCHHRSVLFSPTIEG